MTSNKISWSVNENNQRFTFKIPLKEFERKNKWWEVWKKNDFNNKYINRQIKIIKIFNIE
jgi:hypothetical protein